MGGLPSKNLVKPSDAISVDLSVEWIIDEGVDCTTVNEEFLIIRNRKTFLIMI